LPGNERPDDQNGPLLPPLPPGSASRRRSAEVSRSDSTISTTELRQRLTDPDLTIVDVRG